MKSHCKKKIILNRFECILNNINNLEVLNYKYYSKILNKIL